MFLQKLKRKKYKNLNKILISKNSLINNLNEIRRLHPEAQICPVLKSNAYGHGLKIVAEALDKESCPFFIVDSLYEAYELYKLGVKTEILILGYTVPENFKVKKLPFSYVVYDLDLARVLNEYQQGAKVHVFVDTGMNREGIRLEELKEFIAKIIRLKNIQIEGICSHFADADNFQNNVSLRAQTNNFREAVKIFKDAGINPKWKHISASAGAYKLFDNEYNMIRAGKALYGINPLNKKDKFYSKGNLKPVLSFTSTLVQIKNLKKGDKVGYGFTYKSLKDIKIGLIPAGYYDGVDRRLSNKGFVKVSGEFAPIIGRVSMNMTTIDLSKVKNPYVGQEVVIYSGEDRDKNSIRNSSQAAETIPHEILVHLAESVKREAVL